MRINLKIGENLIYTLPHTSFLSTLYINIFGDFVKRRHMETFSSAGKIYVSLDFRYSKKYNRSHPKEGPMKKSCFIFGLFLAIIVVSPGFMWENNSRSHRLDQMDLQGLEIFNIPQIAPKPYNGADMQREWYNEIEDGTYIEYLDEDEFWMTVPVHLPHNATIKKFALLVVHDYSGAYMEAYLVRHDPITNMAVPLAETSTEGLPVDGTVRVVLDETVDEPVVINTRYDYFVLVYFSRGCGTDLAFRGTRIAYE